MKTNSLLGLGRFLIPIPATIGQKLLLRKARQEAARLASIRSDEHHRIYDFVTTEITRRGEPISPAFIGQQLNMSIDRVNVILNELEKKLILFRDGQGAVVWSYPVTVAKTPHHYTFSTGEQGYAACAIDTVATPFVQGRLRGKPLSIVAKTECAHCGQSLHIEIDSEMRCRVEEQGADPWIFVPDVDFSKLTEPSITDVF